MKDEFYLEKLMQAVENVFLHRGGKPANEIKASDTIYKAVLFELIVIGEMAGKLSKATREIEGEVPWHRVIGMRNRLVHAPYNTDPHAIEEIVSLHLPLFKKNLMRLKKQLKNARKIPWSN